MAAEVSLFGIRHHGPGSARRLVEPLDALRPTTVLIEGPADASHLLPMLADPAMRTPVALLTYAEDDPANASFFPFADYSPEYQAACWAITNGTALRFIDLPAADRLGERGDTIQKDDAAPEDAVAAEDDPIGRDSIGALATAAGYDDGESWWADVIEENPASVPVFADAMTALRSEAGPISAREAAREAHMRLEIARAAKESDGPVAVVCGAWHVPALAARVSLAADRELLKGRPKAKMKATWRRGPHCALRAPAAMARAWSRPAGARISGTHVTPPIAIRCGSRGSHA